MSLKIAMLAVAAAFSFLNVVAADQPAALTGQERNEMRFTVNQLEVLQECRKKEQALREAAGIVAAEPKDRTGLERYRKMRIAETKLLLQKAKRWPKGVEAGDQKRVTDILKAERAWLREAALPALERDRSCWMEAMIPPLQKRQVDAWLELKRLAK